MKLMITSRIITGLSAALLLAFGVASCRQRSDASAVITSRSDLLNYTRPLGEIANDLDTRQTSIVIEKSKYRLTLKYKGKLLKSYPVVFGGNPVDDKRREGDRCTPEGKFKIEARYPHRLWNKFMLLNYPTAESWRKFNEAKRSGKMRSTATIGGSVGIHGVPERHDDAIDARNNWTLGCISLKNSDVDELYGAVRVGTPIEISH